MHWEEIEAYVNTLSRRERRQFLIELENKVDALLDKMDEEDAAEYWSKAP